MDYRNQQHACENQAPSLVNNTLDSSYSLTDNTLKIDFVDPTEDSLLYLIDVDDIDEVGEAEDGLVIFNSEDRYVDSLNLAYDPDEPNDEYSTTTADVFELYLGDDEEEDEPTQLYQALNVDDEDTFEDFFPADNDFDFEIDEVDEEPTNPTSLDALL